MIGCTVKESSRSGARGMRRRLRLARTRVSATRVAEAAHRSSPAPSPSSTSAAWPVRVRKTSSRVGRRIATSSMPTPASLSRMHRRGDRALALADRHPQDAVDEGRALRRDRLQRRDRRLGVGLVLQRHVEPLAADLVLELVGAALGDDPAVVDHRDAVGEPVGLVEVLGGEQHRGAVGDPPFDRLPEADAAARVEPGGRLVEEEDRRPRDQRRGEVEAAAHPARVGAHQAVGGVAEVEALQQLGGAARAARPSAGGRGGRPSPGSRPRSGSRRRPRTGRRGRSGCAAAAPRRSTSSPATRALPPSGGSSVVRMRTAVVLPAPFGPEQAEHRAGRDAQVDAVERAARPRRTCAVPRLRSRRRQASGQPTECPVTAGLIVEVEVLRRLLLEPELVVLGRVLEEVRRVLEHVLVGRGGRRRGGVGLGLAVGARSELVLLDSGAASSCSSVAGISCPRRSPRSPLPPRRAPRARVSTAGSAASTSKIAVASSVGGAPGSSGSGASSAWSSSSESRCSLKNSSNSSAGSSSSASAAAATSGSPDAASIPASGSTGARRGSAISASTSSLVGGARPPSRRPRTRPRRRTFRSAARRSRGALRSSGSAASIGLGAVGAGSSSAGRLVGRLVLVGGSSSAAGVGPPAGRRCRVAARVGRRLLARPCSPAAPPRAATRNSVGASANGSCSSGRAGGPNASSSSFFSSASSAPWARFSSRCSRIASSRMLMSPFPG